jgi:2-polyprenyl-3-methyl-5-hydroxy-6-metoxy-1,4-benzoquinol methylase
VNSLVSRKEDFSRPWYKLARESIKDLDLRDKKVLDLGCGMGEFSRILHEMGAEVICVDLSDESVSYVKSLGFEVVKADLNDPLPYGDRSFDLVVLLDVLEHIFNSKDLLMEINRILKPEGYLLLSTPNSAFFVERIRFLFGKPILDEGYHCRFFTHKSGCLCFYSRC